MSRIKYLSGFDKRISFFSSIINRNDNFILKYKSKIPLVLKHESLDSKNSNLKIENKTFKYFINNKSFSNKYIDENLINLYSFKLTSYMKNQNNKEVSLENKTFLNHNVSNNINHNTLMKYENKTSLNKYLTNNTSNMSINKKEYTFKNNSSSEEINIENKNESFIFKKENEVEKQNRDKEIEQRVIQHFEEKKDEKTILKSINNINISKIENKHILNKREEKILTNRIYKSVIEKWDKETKRKGYLYE